MNPSGARARAEVTPGAVERLRATVAKRLGLHFDDGKSAFLGEVLQRRLDHSGRRLDDYLLRLEARDPPADELRLLAQELTVTETYFFRSAEQLRVLTEVALPARARARPGRLRVLSAGCASGEEPYSMAILLYGQADPCPWDVDLQAIDINRAMLNRAEQGLYARWALRETPAEVQARCFRPQGRDFLLDERFRALVTFSERNLTSDDPAFWLPDAFDVVFCRNVLMYFSADVAAAVVARLAGSLAPGGFLFLGYAETLRGLSHDFHLLHTHDAFYYQRRQPWECAAAPAGAVAPPAFPSSRDGRGDGADVAWATGDAAGAPERWTGESAPRVGESWVETIRQAAHRVASLTEHPEVSTPDLPARTPRTWDLTGALELMRQEKFADALAVMKALPPEAAHDPDALLLRAVLLTQGGDLVAAQALCADLLRLDEMSAGAHYLMALCREGNGDREGAVDQDKTAAYLDPLFAMPRLHLGLLARRTGDQATARRELAEALRLLQGEEAARLLLFGGGFSRDALLALCRGELAASGGAS